MASIEFTARRTAFAVALGLAVVAAPAVATFGGSPDAGAPRVVAEPPGCAVSTEPGDESLNCAPGDIPEVEAPSEMELTDTNPGVHSPAHGR
jgi:hypothetical protein